MMNELSNCTVLVVDDAKSNIDILVDALHRDYEVSVAMTGKSALQIVNTDPPDLILLDIMMPDIDGYEVCRRIKSKPGTSGIPIIFITAMDEIENKTKGLDLGAVDYVTKPFEAKEVKARVKTHLSLMLANKKLQQLSSHLSKYVSSEVIHSIMDGKTEDIIESSRKTLSVFFSDIVGFTKKTELLEPKNLTLLLNKYFNRMESIVRKYHGTLDKYIGDAIMVFFGDPTTKGTKEDALSCVKMAMEMQKQVLDLSGEWNVQGLNEALQIRIGIFTGYCTVGNFGSEEQMDYTIIGNPVNAASRLETAAGPGEILISHDTWLLINEYVEGEEMDAIVVKGFRDPLRVYRVSGSK
ncbi:MAG: adenylate/guanylate cyclase domain-containing response regulator [Candidatus Scalindua sp.]|nr:adenylate/guanylate cyclase domain-containing response regulator [Candidatus Scalindua sp.]